jgi:hypothetical protein
MNLIVQVHKIHYRIKKVKENKERHTWLPEDEKRELTLCSSAL